MHGCSLPSLPSLPSPPVKLHSWHPSRLLFTAGKACPRPARNAGATAGATGAGAGSLGLGGLACGARGCLELQGSSASGCTMAGAVASAQQVDARGTASIRNSMHLVHGPHGDSSWQHCTQHTPAVCRPQTAHASRAVGPQVQYAGLRDSDLVHVAESTAFCSHVS